MNLLKRWCSIEQGAIGKIIWRSEGIEPNISTDDIENIVVCQGSGVSCENHLQQAHQQTPVQKLELIRWT